MNFFDLIGKAIDVAKAEKDKYVNVTKNFSLDLPKGIGKVINISSDNISLHIGHSDSGLGLSVYLYEPYDVNSVQIECKTEEDVTYFKSHCSNSFTKGYVELSIPHCEKLFVETQSANVTLKHIVTKLAELNVVNGNIVVRNIISESGNVVSQNGNIVVENIETQKTNIETRTGNIVLKIMPDTYKLSVKTDSGNIVQKGNINVPESNKIISCITRSGNIVVKTN